MVANNFLFIISQTKFCLAYNQREKSRYDNIPLNFEGIRCIRYLPTKDMQTSFAPPPQFWSSFYWWCAMCWNDWNINISSSGLQKKLGYKNDQKILTRKNINRKNEKIKNLIFLLIQSIPHLSCEFQHFPKKIIEIFLFKYWNIFEKKMSHIFGGGLYLFFSIPHLTLS